MAFEVTPDNRPPAERTRRFAGVATAEPDTELAAEPRLISMQVVLDSLGGVLIVGGMACGDAAAFLAGGKIPGLATLGGCLIALGAVLAYR